LGRLTKRKRQGGDRKSKKKKNTGNKAKQKEVKACKRVPLKARDKKSKEVGKYTYHWCKHHMAWCIHKLSECCLGKEQKEEQPNTKLAYTANSVTYAATTASMNNLHFQALLTTIGTALQREDEEK
jgi:hypothetical protein